MAKKKILYRTYQTSAKTLLDKLIFIQQISLWHTMIRMRCNSNNNMLATPWTPARHLCGKDRLFPLVYRATIASLTLTSTFKKTRMGELEPWMDENWIRAAFYSAGHQVSVKMIRDKFTGYLLHSLFLSRIKNGVFVAFFFTRSI